jgi:hypothetical protein
MFKVGDKSESATVDRDGGRGRILTPEAVHERAIHPYPENTVLSQKNQEITGLSMGIPRTTGSECIVLGIHGKRFVSILACGRQDTDGRR